MQQTPDDEAFSMNRRRLLGLTAGSIVGATALAALPGSALAWTDRRIEFKGCSEVWVMTTQSDLKDGTDVTVSKPPVAHVVVDLGDGTSECRELRATHQHATTVPGQYGDLAVLKLAVDEGEKILGVMTYNRLADDPWENRFDSPSCWAVNEHVCASNASTSFFDADCIQDALSNVNAATYECDASTVTGSWERGNGNRPTNGDESTAAGATTGTGKARGRGR